MKSVALVCAGLLAGFVTAGRVRATPGGRALLDDIDDHVRRFLGAVVSGYRQRESELRAAAPEG